jgi:hypothetical protein
LGKAPQRIILILRFLSESYIDMAKSGQGRENMLAAISGGVAAIIGDFVWNSMRLPGFDEPSALKFLFMGDVYQMGGSAALTSFGFTKGCSRMSPFGFGAFLTQVATKVIFPAFDLPRYILFDIDKKGRLVPKQRWPQ